MPEYRQIVGEYILASKTLMELEDLSNQEMEAIRVPLERLLAVIGHCDEE